MSFLFIDTFLAPRTEPGTRPAFNGSLSPVPPHPHPPSHGAGRQVGVFMLELPIQGKTTLLPVVTEQRGYGVHLAERGTGRHLVTGGGGVGNKIVGVG